MSTDLGVRGHADRSHDRGTAAPALVPSPVAHGLSAALAVTAVSAALPTVLLDGVLHGPPGMNGSARGTALVMIVLGVPMLLAGQAGTRRGWSPALPVWLGAVSNLLYNGFMLLFATPFNRLFLLYVATFLLALWSLVAVLRVVDIPALGARVAPGVPRRAIAVFVWVLVALNAAAWLKGIVPGMGQGADPAFLVGTGLTTFPTYVQDLAVWLPLLAVAAYWLWRGLARGLPGGGLGAGHVGGGGGLAPPPRHRARPLVHQPALRVGTGEPISGEAISIVLRKRARAAGLAAERITVHSPRAGHATSAAVAGVALDRIAVQTRHKRLSTLIER